MVDISEQRESQPSDWHKADIVAALRKAGWSLRRLSAQHGYHPQALKNALHRPWPRAERLIAEAIGVEPTTIWPSRYDAAGRPNRRRGGRALLHGDTVESTSAEKPRN